MHSTKCSTQPQIALATVMIFLTGCAGVGSDKSHSACPPFLEYSRAEQALVAEEVTALSKDALIVEWLADYAVLRAQVRSCDTRRT
jgi:hypothetical protein